MSQNLRLDSGCIKEAWLTFWDDSEGICDKFADIKS
jgi:hypothetical protein